MSFDVTVRKRLGDTQIAASFATGPGLTALHGPSGAGKTTILNMIAGLLTPDAGHIAVNGERLFDATIDRPSHARRIGYVFQEPRLFPHRRVRANLLYGQRRTRPEHRWLAFDDAVDFLALRPLLDRWPQGLSGGEARRVAIGRALLSGPRTLLLDEPLSSLDAERREEILRMIEHIRDALRLPILYVSHDADEVARLATHRIEISRAGAVAKPSR